MKKRYMIAGASGLAGVALAAKLLSRPSDVVWEEHAEHLHHAERSRFALVDGVRVHYQEAGASDAPPLILIHGYIASNYVWSDVLLPIAEAGFRVIAPDLVGFGFSEKPKANEYTIDAQARMIVGLMGELGIERATLIGSSYGGAIAATCALDYASRVEKLVLVGAVTNDDAKKQLLLRLATSPVMGDVISPLMLGSRRLMKWRLSRTYAPENTHLFDVKLEAKHRPLRAANTQRAALQTLRRWSADRIEREAERIKQPALLIWGENDHDIPLANGQRLFEKMPDARLIVFRRCGHLPQEEYPDEFIKLVVEFCPDAKATRPEHAAEPLTIDKGLPVATSRELESVLEL
jgi:pimeloyl-ACP methyl ester carboxylesterase